MTDESVSTAPAEPVSAPGKVVKSRGMAGTVFDMVRSLGVIVVIVAVTLIFVPGLLHPSKSQRFHAVGYSDDVQGFRQVTGLNAVVPTGLASPWYANSASLKYSGTHARLHIGWVSPTKDYAALEESNSVSKVFVTAALGVSGLTPTGHEQIAGTTWVRSVSRAGETSLYRTANGVTVVITGSASLSQQEQLAASLTSA